MLTAIPRYGARVIHNTEQTISAVRSQRQLVRGDHIREFESAFARRVQCSFATATSYGRMAFYYLLKAFNLPRDAEIVFPALTFWAIPELARVAGLRPVFADVNPRTFTIDPDSLEDVITPRTRAVVPTHLYGLPCDMAEIVDLARRHNLIVIEDCAHALGATYDGQPVGSMGDAGFFSLQLLTPLNTYGGGMAVTSDPAIAARVRGMAEAEPWPGGADVHRRLRLGQMQRIAIRPPVFTWSLFPVLWAASYVQSNPDVYLWEKIRPLNPLPSSYRQRFSNAQAAIGLESLRHLDEWTARTVAHAETLTEWLKDAWVDTPVVPPGRTHVYHQYPIYARNRDEVVRKCIRRGVDVEPQHVDVCTRLPLFGGRHAPMPGAERAAAAIQLPVHASLTDADMQRIARVVWESVAIA